MIDGNELTIVPQFQDAKAYHISIPRVAIVGLNGKDFSGLADYIVSTAGILFFRCSDL